MEFRLNKVDVEIRQKVKDTTKSGKVHSKENVKVDNEEGERHKQKHNDKSSGKLREDKHNKNLKIIIEATKESEEDNIEIDAVKECEKDKEIKRGVFLDTKK